MGKCRSGCAEHENEGFYYRLLSLYNSYFLHLYPMPEQKIENIKKNNKIQKNSPENSSCWPSTLNALASLDANAQVWDSPSSSSS